MSGTLTLELSDMHRDFRLNGIEAKATVGELISAAIPKMKLPSRDDRGAPVRYRARHERAGRHMHDHEIVGETLKNDDRLILEPNIEAG